MNRLLGELAAIADKVVDAVKTGKIKHIFLVGGYEGAKALRSYRLWSASLTTRHREAG
ncbi:hypothetical protein [Desulfoscipio gibsoniae]|uniref:hypothetical protein n=1 Tax=Desulfoscipio gibsoniae TaxID=102134 RepID=UPI000308630D|nr:hypothetical protein [Desulfoscipio gibsoniae]